MGLQLTTPARARQRFFSDVGGTTAGSHESVQIWGLERRPGEGERDSETDMRAFRRGSGDRVPEPDEGLDVPGPHLALLVGCLKQRRGTSFPHFSKNTEIGNARAALPPKNSNFLVFSETNRTTQAAVPRDRVATRTRTRPRCDAAADRRARLPACFGIVARTDRIVILSGGMFY